jgi:hypothetical protein
VDAAGASVSGAVSVDAAGASAAGAVVAAFPPQAVIRTAVPTNNAAIDFLNIMCFLSFVRFLLNLNLFSVFCSYSFLMI